MHERAMSLADAAMVARMAGDEQTAANLLHSAFEHERDAALSVSSNLEPTRSILLRSAASLALESSENREAERLIGMALSGEPPEEIADELRDLLEQVYFQRHLATRGIVLQQDEFQMSIAGASVGYGISESGQFVERVKDLEKLVYRTAERKLGHAYRESGKPTAKLQREVQLYLSTPRAASFAVTFRLGKKEQPSLPGMDLAREIIDEILDCFILFAAAQYEQLSQRITDNSYYRNFVGLARQIAPDGEDIKLVGLTARREERERQVVLATPRKQLPPTEIAAPPPPDAAPIMGHVPAPFVQVRGVLKMADSRDEARGLIDVVDSNGQSHTIQVPTGMMSDIVKPMYEEQVDVVGRRDGQLILLDTIDRVT